jgi:endoglucanase
MDKGEVGLLLRQLVSIDGPSGAEAPVSSTVRALCAPYAPDISVDVMGSVIAHRQGGNGGNGKGTVGRVMLAAHMDEIGLMVTKIEDSFLHVARTGGVEPRNLIAQEVTVYPTGTGAERFPGGLPGYIGARPPHVLAPEDQEKVVPLADLRVDVGFSAEGLVRVGDRVVVRGPYTELMGGRVATKALDNRASVTAMVATLGYLAGSQHSWDVYAVATVQEEVGLKGAATSSFAVNPDIAVAIDVTHGDMPGVDDSETAAMDKGPVIAWGPNLHPALVKRLRATAEDLEMEYVDEPIPGRSGTDAWAIQMARAGVPSGLVSIPVRYMHSPVEMVVLADIDRVARLLAAFISRLDGAFLATLPEEV